VPSLHNFLLYVSLVINIVEIIKVKKKHKGKNRKGKKYITSSLKMKDEVENCK
jgi:hypothetical protein